MKALLINPFTDAFKGTGFGLNAEARFVWPAAARITAGAGKSEARTGKSGRGKGGNRDAGRRQAAAARGVCGNGRQKRREGTGRKTDARNGRRAGRKKAGTGKLFRFGVFVQKPQQNVFGVFVVQRADMAALGDDFQFLGLYGFGVQAARVVGRDDDVVFGR